MGKKKQISKPLGIPAEIDAELTPKVRRYIKGLLKDLAETKSRLARLESQMEKLTSQNSSIPPSVQHPHARPPASANKGQSKPRKKQGAQLGHARKTRPLVPVEQCDEVLTLKPTQCRGCQETLTGSDVEPLRHQVIDIPVPKPIVTEYQLHRLSCRCGKQTCATLPTGVPSGQCGPRLTAFAGLLMVHFRQSKRRTANFLSDILNVPCSTGWTVKMQNIASQAVAAPYEELHQQLTQQRQLYVDESPTKEQNQKAWLWVAVAPMFAVFGIFLNRKRDTLKSLVGDYSNTILNCDRAKMYLDATTLQWCWAHLKRDIQRLIDSSDTQVRRLGHDLMREQRKIFQLWHEYRDKKISWTKFKRDAVPICEQFDASVLRGAFSGNPKLKGMCDGIYENRDWLWTFTKVKDVEPTNNTAERALRGAVIYRKLSFGTQSSSGSRFVERMLTVTETCRLQKRSVFEYVTQAVQASFSNQPSPSLMPQQAIQATKVA